MPGVNSSIYVTQSIPDDRPLTVQYTMKVETPTQPEVHHDFLSHSLEDKTRIKQTMMRSHIMVALKCDRHHDTPGRLIICHYVSVCNCSGYTMQELNEIFEEVYTDFAYPVQYTALSTGRAYIPSVRIKEIMIREMGVLNAFTNHTNGPCCTKHLKLKSLRTAYMHLMSKHLQRGCRSQSSGFILFDPPENVPYYYTTVVLGTMIP